MIEGSDCQRKKPCSGKVLLDHEVGISAASRVWQVFRCDKCRKKHLSTRKE